MSLERPPADDGRELKTAAVRRLQEGGNGSAAALLQACIVLVREAEVGVDDVLGRFETVDVEVVAPTAAYAALGDCSRGLGAEIAAALGAALPPGSWIEKLICTLEDATPELTQPVVEGSEAELEVGSDVHNQGANASLPHVWNGLRFRSASEVCIAEALERAGALFLPNCLARLGDTGARQNREADFLVCHEGRWGILEVDGAPFHPPSRAAHDHARDRLFRAHGVRVVEHFDAGACRERPDAVVRQFLEILRHA